MLEQANMKNDVLPPVEQEPLPRDSHAESGRYAVVVGVNSSSKLELLGPLKSPERNAQRIAEVLQQPSCGFRLVRPPIIGEMATSDMVIDAIYALHQERTENDFLVFYFSGHGLPLRDRDDEDQVFLVTADLNAQQAIDLPDRYITLTLLRKMLYERTQAGQVLIILDCCHAGDSGRHE